MSSPLFARLLELYRADMLSSFARPEPYYHACRLYQRHLRGRPLPQRTPTPGRRRGPRARRFKVSSSICRVLIFLDLVLSQSISL